MNQRLLIGYELIRFGSDILKIVAVLVKSDIAFTGVFLPKCQSLGGVNSTKY